MDKDEEDCAELKFGPGRRRHAPSRARARARTPHRVGRERVRALRDRAAQTTPGSTTRWLVVHRSRRHLHRARPAGGSAREPRVRARARARHTRPGKRGSHQAHSDSRRRRRFAVCSRRRTRVSSDRSTTISPRRSARSPRCARAWARRAPRHRRAVPLGARGLAAEQRARVPRPRAPRSGLGTDLSGAGRQAARPRPRLRDRRAREPRAGGHRRRGARRRSRPSLSRFDQRQTPGHARHVS